MQQLGRPLEAEAEGVAEHRYRDGRYPGEEANDMGPAEDLGYVDKWQPYWSSEDTGQAEVEDIDGLWWEDMKPWGTIELRSND